MGQGFSVAGTRTCKGNFQHKKPLGKWIRVSFHAMFMIMSDGEARAARAGGGVRRAHAVDGDQHRGPLRPRSRIHQEGAPASQYRELQSFVNTCAPTEKLQWSDARWHLEPTCAHLKSVA